MKLTKKLKLLKKHGIEINLPDGYIDKIIIRRRLFRGLIIDGNLIEITPDMLIDRDKPAISVYSNHNIIRRFHFNGIY